MTVVEGKTPSVSSIASVLELIGADLTVVEGYLKGVADVEYPLLKKLLGHVVGGQGKRARPMITLLVGRLYGRPLDRFYPLAAAIELLHTATLVHDDLVDSADLRRGEPTLNTMIRTGPTVLIGDYLFANSAYMLTQADNNRATAVFSRTLMVILEGELRQAFTQGEWRQSLDAYYAKIGAKTAALFGCAAETAAILCDLPETQIRALADYGYHLGTAFQIVDDVLDCIGDEATLGKPGGSDLRQGNLTLPMICYLRSAPPENPVRALFDGNLDHDDEAHIQRGIVALRASPAIAEAMAEARRYAERAIEYLDDAPANQFREALICLAEYTVSREF